MMNSPNSTLAAGRGSAGIGMAPLRSDLPTMSSDLKCRLHIVVLGLGLQSDGLLITIFHSSDSPWLGSLKKETLLLEFELHSLTQQYLIFKAATG